MESSPPSEGDPQKPDDRLEGEASSDQPEKRKGSRLQKIDLGQRWKAPDLGKSKEDRLFTFLPYIVIAVILIGAAVMLYVLITREEASEEETVAIAEVREEEIREEPIETFLNPKRLENAFLEANGGREYLENLQSISLVGQTLADGKEASFRLVKRIPNQSLLKTTSEDVTVIVGVDQEVAWKAVQKDSVYLSASFLQGQARAEAVHSARFFEGLLEHFLTGAGELQRVTTSEFEGRECIEVDLFEEDGDDVRYLIDPKEMVVVLKISERDGSTVETFFSDFHQVGQMKQPFKNETLVNGELTRTLMVESAEVNVGVHPFIFRKPVVAQSSQTEVERSGTPTSRMGQSSLR